ncbi:response regulator [Amphibacillus jilinensis]|uniref:response regulator n=1 Tax=Amphibacillus jilinensis TaxID=1216008 RepID=UPI0002F68942|nr:response regulator transcription factor [Amphibacillus jilinensis]
MGEEKILVVEDDKQIKKFIRYALEKEGYIYSGADNAQDALEILVTEDIQLILLDLGLPDFDGMEVLEKVREWADIPVIIISSRDQDEDKVKALDQGADDYLTKPFSIIELLARIRVAIRHINKLSTDNLKPIFTIGNLKLDVENHNFYREGERLHLTPMEFKLLEILFKNAGKVLTTQNIIRQIWGPGYGNDTQALRTLMAGLRRKVEENAAKPQYIITEIGIGYRLRDE